MQNNPKSKLEQLEKQGADWYVDRYESIRVERNRYFVLTIICLAALILSVIANLLLSPLKTAVPYVIEVNKDNGMTSVLKPADKKFIKDNEAVTVYFLYKYMHARMSYDYQLRQINANIVRALSTTQTYQQYAKQMNTTNPDSPIRRYQNTSKIDMKITGYSFPYTDIAQIHFYTELMNNNTATTKPARQYWQATIKFAYANAPLPMDDRINYNPLGFFITSFQLNQEIPREDAKS